MKTNGTPTKTEYLLDGKIYLTYKTELVHLYVFIYEKFYFCKYCSKKSQINIPNSHFTTTWFIALLEWASSCKVSTTLSKFDLWIHASLEESCSEFVENT